MPVALTLACHLRRSLSSKLAGNVLLCHSRAYSSTEAKVDAVVVGAGVVGLAVGRALALRGVEVIVADPAGNIGAETSSRSSEVIHAGIYYPPGSLKSRLCVTGKHLLYNFCQQYDVPHRRIGKLVVATSQEQLGALKALQDNAMAAGVPLQWLTGDEARGMEPELQCQAALLSPTTGIVDSHSLMAELHRQLEEAGGTLALHTRVVGGRVKRAAVPPQTLADCPHRSDPGASSTNLCISAARSINDSVHSSSSTTTTSSSSRGGLRQGGIPLVMRDEGSAGELELEARAVVNAAGLWAQDVARSLQGLDPSTIPSRFLAKGSYFSLSGHPPFRHLIYPMPEASTAGLGTHLTLDLGGQAKFGPNVEWLPEKQDPCTVDYTVDPGIAESFYPAIQNYWPGLPFGSLHPSYSGVRPKVSGPGMGAGDFIIQGKAHHGVEGLVNLYGIESPGLTASLAIAEEVAGLLSWR